MDKLHKERCQLFDVEMLSNLHGKFIDYNDHWNDNKQICVWKGVMNVISFEYINAIE